MTVHVDSASSDSDDGNYIISVKGAPDIILLFCSTILLEGEVKPINDFHLECFRRDVQDFLLKGHTVIGYCDMEMPKSNFPSNFEFREDSIPLKGLRFLGMISIHDPVRPSSVEAVRNFRNAGIKVSEAEFLNLTTL
ncbi:hypothetical protein CDAR_385761 [Caerostris darwini]|uniref:Uncharacterized protein n=1 Tax=Caerostris darwini TaxID=1538125 RepID=A0AAV4S5A1_9ARAC|nr:hypothetical protein CDAR_385761 [Caerostris darwini]